MVETNGPDHTSLSLPEHSIANHPSNQTEGNGRTSSGGDSDLVGSSQGNTERIGETATKIIKQLLKSKTVRVAIVQAIVGIIVVLQANSAEFKSLGFVTVAKTALDIYLRMNTTIPVQEIK